MDDRRQSESSDALDAVEAVIRSAPRGKRNFFEANLIPCKGDTPRERSRKIILDLCLLIILVCALVILWVTVLDPMSAENKRKDLVDIYNGTPGVTQATQPGEEAAETTRPPEKVRKTADQLRAINDDYIGWLKAPGASIDMPVVQTANNNYYLYRNFERKPSRYGNPFMDYRVTLDPLSSNLVIYGHHMSNGKIFTKLINYQQVDTVRKHPIITLELPDQVMQFKIISVLVVNGRPQDDNGYVFAVNTPDFASKEKFDGYIRQLQRRTYIRTGVDVKWGDTLIGLQTCVYDFKDEYLYVIGRMVRPGEKAEVPASQIKKNPDPQVPQALCDKYGWANHHKNAERWTP